MNLLTYSRMRAFRACPRRHYLRYELGLSPEEKSSALNVGRAFHEMLDARQKQITPKIGEIDRYDLATTAAMIAVYDEVHEPLDIVETELCFELPLVHLATGRHSRVWRWAGVLDAIALLKTGEMALIERKTTTRDISPSGEYWQMVMRDQQISQYVLAARKLGWPVGTVLYDVVRRPLNRPRLATFPQNRKYKKDGTLYANQRETDETPEAFAKRLADVMRSNPEKHFQRIEIPRLKSDLNRTAEDQWMLQHMIRKAQNTNEWPRNPGSCLTPYKCPFLKICDLDNLEKFTPHGFIRLRNPHPELEARTPENPTTDPLQSKIEIPAP